MSQSSYPTLPSYKSHKEDPPPPSYSSATERTPLFSHGNNNDRYSRESYIRISISPTDSPARKFNRKVNRWMNGILMGVFIGCLVGGVVVLGRGLFMWFHVTVEEVSIGVLGAGPAGISTIYTLSQLSLPIKNHKKTILKLTLLDKNPHLGGRLTLPFPSSNTTLGKELHIEDLTTACISQSSVLSARADSELSLNYGVNRGFKPALTKTGFYDGHRVVADIPRPRKIDFGNWLKLVWRYGASVWRAGVLPDGTTGSFVRMMRESSFPSSSESAVYESVWGIIENGGMTGAVGLGAVERLRKNGIGGRYVEEILRAQVRRQGGAEVEEISDLALSVLLARENGATCFNGEGGRVSEVFKKFVEKSGVHLKLDTEVTGIKQEFISEGNKTWILETKSTTNTTAEPKYTAFDHLIIAAPLNQSLFFNTTIQNLTSRDQTIYRPLHVTFILTTSIPFGLSAMIPTTPSVSLLQQTNTNTNTTTKNPEIYELTHLRPIYRPTTQSLVNKTSLYRLLSNTTIPDEQIHTLFNGASNVEEILRWEIENAWPVNIPRSSGERLGGFKFGNGLWGTGMGEGIVSSIDWSWVVGENAGRFLGREIGG